MARTLRADVGAIGARAARVWSGAPGWVAGAVTGAQAAAMSLAIVLALALLSVAAAPSADGSTAVDWEGASRVGLAFWLLAFGVPSVAGGATVTLAPLGITILSAAIAGAVARRFAAPSRGSWIAASVTYGLLVSLAASVSTVSPEGSGAAARGGLTAGIVAAIGVAWGLHRGHGYAAIAIRNMPPIFLQGLRLARASLGLALGAATITLLVWALVGWHDAAQIGDELGAGPVGVAAFAVAQLAYLPTLAVWMGSWLTGLGFSVGEGSLYAPSEVVAEPLPLVPAFGALPHAAGGALVWVPIVLVAVGIVARLWRAPVVAEGRQGLFAALMALPATAIAVGVAAAMTTGSIGPGRLAINGAEPWSVGIVAALLLFAGHLVAAFALWWRATSVMARASARERRVGPTPTARRPPSRTRASGPR